MNWPSFGLRRVDHEVRSWEQRRDAVKVNVNGRTVALEPKEQPVEVEEHIDQKYLGIGA